MSVQYKRKIYIKLYLRKENIPIAIPNGGERHDGINPLPPGNLLTYR